MLNLRLLACYQFDGKKTHCWSSTLGVVHDVEEIAYAYQWMRCQISEYERYANIRSRIVSTFQTFIRMILYRLFS